MTREYHGDVGSKAWEKDRLRRVLAEALGRDTEIVDITNGDALLKERAPGPVMDKLYEELEADIALRDGLIVEYDKAKGKAQSASNAQQRIWDRIKNLNNRAAATRVTMETLAKRPDNQP